MDFKTTAAKIESHSAPYYMCDSRKETTCLQALVSSYTTWKNLDLPHKVIWKLSEISSACKKEDNLYFHILCTEGA